MKRDSIIVNILTLSMLAAAVIHLWIIPLHWAHAVAHGVLFLILGILEVFWSFAFVKKPSIKLSRWGIYLAGSSITLWVITRFLQAPFGHGPEEFSLAGIITKIVEVLVIIFLFVWLKAKVSLKKMIGFLAISLAIGVFVYIGGKLAEPLFPWLKSSQLHHGHEVNDHLI